METEKQTNIMDKARLKKGAQAAHAFGAASGHHAAPKGGIKSPESPAKMPAQPFPKPITSDLAALYEIIRADKDVRQRLDAAAHLLALIAEGREIDRETIAALFDAEKDVAVSAALKRILNKIKIRQQLVSDPTTPYDRKLTPEQAAGLQAEIDRLRGLYDKFQGKKGAFDRQYGQLVFIAQGGMGKLYRATRRQDNQLVVIKFLLLDELSRDARPDHLIARFRREGELLTRRLHHPGILKGYEYGEAGGEHFIVLEYMAGGSLDKLLSAKPLPYPLFKEMTLQLCDAVGYIHRQGIIHRDIHPANVLLAGQSSGPSGSAGAAGGTLQIKLADFGLAKDKGDPHLSRYLDRAGTDDFSSPQQFANPRAVDERDDIFSLGKTFYEMLTGRTLKKDAPFVPIVMEPSRRADALNALILKCIDPVRENRWQNIETLETALRKIT